MFAVVCAALEEPRHRKTGGDRPADEKHRLRSRQIGRCCHEFIDAVAAEIVRQTFDFGGGIPDRTRHLRGLVFQFGGGAADRASETLNGVNAPRFLVFRGFGQFVADV